MNNELQKECFKTADKIITILSEMGYTTKTVPAYPNLLRDLIMIEVKRNINTAVNAFYNSVNATVTTVDVSAEVEKDLGPANEQWLPSGSDQEAFGGGCCGGDCGCHDEEDKLPDGFDDPANPRND